MTCTQGNHKVIKEMNGDPFVIHRSQSCILHPSLCLWGRPVSPSFWQLFNGYIKQQDLIAHRNWVSESPWLLPYMISRGHTEGNSKHHIPQRDKLGKDEKKMHSYPLNHQTSLKWPILVWKQWIRCFTKNKKGQRQNNRCPR